jgi:hypothetical protein
MIMRNIMGDRVLTGRLNLDECAKRIPKDTLDSCSLEIYATPGVSIGVNVGQSIIRATL